MKEVLSDKSLVKKNERSSIEQKKPLKYKIKLDLSYPNVAFLNLIIHYYNKTISIHKKIV
jgi:hypothetical protein